MGGGRIGVSLFEPLRTPTQSPPKNIYKTKNLQKHYQKRKIQKKNKTIKTKKYKIQKTS